LLRWRISLVTNCLVGEIRTARDELDGDELHFKAIFQHGMRVQAKLHTLRCRAYSLNGEIKSETRNTVKDDTLGTGVIMHRVKKYSTGKGIRYSNSGLKIRNISDAGTLRMGIGVRSGSGRTRRNRYWSVH
jgi:hypothetical protein